MAAVWQGADSGSRRVCMVSRSGMMSPDPLRAVRIRARASLLLEMSLHRAHRDNQPIGDLTVEQTSIAIAR